VDGSVGNSVFLSALISDLFIWYIINPFEESGNRWSGRPSAIAKATNSGAPRHASYFIKWTAEIYPDETIHRRARFLVIRGIDDEAALTLAAGAIGNRLTNVTLTRVAPAAGGLFAILLLARIASGGFFDPINFGDTQQFMGWLISILLLISILVIAALFLPGAFKTVFGKEFLFGSARCDIAANSVPDFSNEIDVITFPQDEVSVASRTLRHAIYEHPSCAKEIVNWIVYRVGHPASVLYHVLNNDFDFEDW
jgi:hypothetical protein